MDVKEELAKKAEHAKNETKLTRSMSIADLIKAMQPKSKGTAGSDHPERFTRMALSALKQYAKLAECDQMSFLAALMNAAQPWAGTEYPIRAGIFDPYKIKDGWSASSRSGIKG